MKTKLLGAFIVGFALVNAAWADDPDWASMPFTNHSAFQQVDGSGFGTFPMTQPVKMRGVLVNNSAQMLDPSAGAPAYLGGVWQVYLQAVDQGDFGGTALWMGQYIGRITGNHPDGSYTDQEWNDEIYRLSHDPETGYAFQVGDLVEIHARAPGLHFRGKNNINEQHANVPEADFDIHLIEADYGLVPPRVVNISDLKDVNDDFIFDSTRAIGCEQYQGELVQIEDVSFVSTTGWAPGASMTITDSSGLTFPVLLGLGDGFGNFPAPTGTFDIMGILDQEDYNSDDGHMAGYRLWLVKDYDGNAEAIPAPFEVPGDNNGDGDVDLVDWADFVECWSGPGVSPSSSENECLSTFDLDVDDDVDLQDAMEFQRAFTGATTI